VPKPREGDVTKVCEPRQARSETERSVSERAPAPPHAGRADAQASEDGARSSSRSAPPPAASATPAVAWLAPNVLSVRHWDRLLGGALYAATPRVDWATLLRRTFSVDVLECAACHGRMRVLGGVTEPNAVRAILERLAMEAEAPSVARARDPTDDEAIEEADAS
jgi:hypothetical protein